MKRGIKWSLITLGVILSTVLLRTFLFTLCTVPARGMEANLLPGDHLYVNKWAYGLRIPFTKTRINYQQPKYGDILLFNNPADTVHRPVYRKDLFISRCVGLPGDTLYVDSIFQIQPTIASFNPDQKELYGYPRIYADEVDSILNVLNIQSNNIVGQDSTSYIRSFTPYEYYLITQATVNLDSLSITAIRKEKPIYPIEVPQKNKPLEITEWNAILIYNTILLHENKKVELIDKKIYLEGTPIDYYTFTQDYYWVSSSNSINLRDSRWFGYVPHSHLIGKASFIWFSKDPAQNIFRGYRWNRLLKSVY